MRYGYRIFNKFNRLVEKLNDERNPYGSLVKLGKASDVEKRFINVYIKGMRSLKSKYNYYKKVISGKIEYSPEMGTESTHKDRAMKALRACHSRAVKIKEKFDHLVNVEISHRYKNDLINLFYFCDRFVHMKRVLNSVNNSVVSDCKLIRFCVCEENNVPPYTRGCMENGNDILMLKDLNTQEEDPIIHCGRAYC